MRRPTTHTFAPFFAVSAVITVLAIFGVLNAMGVVGIWSVYLAYQYAKLWTDGFDWHDVFKQPKDRLFFETISRKNTLIDSGMLTRREAAPASRTASRSQ